MENLSISLVALALCLSGPVLALASLPPVNHGLVLVVSPPWTEREAQILAAGGRGIGPRIAAMGTLAQADAPDFGPRLRAAGPFLVLDGRALTALCGVTG
ncbi:hypothetical protein SAMN06297129_0305 [Pseudooceanicola antarcticus]|uniref:Uncharacterized protein n=1 Tax=Pseudooceanicola antarcticus TaxID=1247613 RepID=A0A285HNX0_9RHOB|nr:hypothetical protein [Pseudooceanicola antarcticus]PJE27736.1 hypothetical protein CVM39_14255 [Pseudooceanicola antarcticus]SNY37377.1 hypothetical protein SAMN06297129_0305 [Pseudooceanicola antarcticus]